MDDREPTRLAHDQTSDAGLRADLAIAKDAWQHTGDAEAAFARFSSAATASHVALSGTKLAFLVGGGLALLGLLGALVVALREPVRNAPPPATATAPAVVLEETVPAPPAPESPAPEPVVAPEPIERTPIIRTRERPVAVVTPPAPEPSPLALLERETLLMSEQRREAQSGDARRSLDIARDAAREFPRGHFSVEREAWSIIALTRLGQTEQARARAERFLAQHPRSPQAALIRRTVGMP